MRNAMCSTIGASVLVLAAAAATHAENVHYTYLWHLEQPIYWPDQQRSGSADRYERAWQSIENKNAGSPFPLNNLNEIFGLDDRKNAYQQRPTNTISDLSWTPEGGAQISFSGGLIANIQSFVEAGSAASYLGYGSNWNSFLSSARTWPTAGPGAQPARADVVVFPFHHPLLPLIDASAARKELELYKHVYESVWGPGVSRGMFPPEMAFSTRLIPILDDLGIEWTFVSAEKISRACADFPVQLGTGGVNCDPPNRADQINPGGNDYLRVSISRGCSPAEAYPFSLTPRRAKYVDPATGAESSVIVVPCSQSLGWEDGYAPLGLSHFDTLNQNNDPSRPMLVVLAHDGDNAWGGGFSYYREAVPNFANQAVGAGYVPTVVERYLKDHPVPTEDYVHVEDGAWVNAEGCFGSPQLLNWNWPPVDAQGNVDIENGWAEDIRNWAVITAAQNHVDTAEQIATDAGQPVRIDHVLNPRSTTRPAERAWHFFLGGLNSGYMYYGTANEFEVKPTMASNEALQHTQTVIGDASNDATGPTVWVPQRFPWNPGSLNFGPHLGYQSFNSKGDFYIWTFVHDVSDVQSVTLKYRLDDDGINPLSSNANEVYADTPGEVGAWQNEAMTGRAFPAGNVYNDPNIDFFEMPQQIADQYYFEVTGVREALIDYYVEAIDSKGNVTRSPIQHVYVGDGAGGGTPGGGGSDDVVTVTPVPAVAGEPVTITYNPSGRVLDGAAQVFIHSGVNGWTEVRPQEAMTFDATLQVWTITTTPGALASVLNFVFNDGAGTWDNNGGADWAVALEAGDVGGGDPPLQWQMDGQLDPEATVVANAPGRTLHAGVSGDTLYVATQSPADHDVFVYVAGVPGALQAANWGKSGQIASWDAFLGAESTNSFAGWFDGAAGTGQVARGTVLEGTINLRAMLGLGPSDDLPESVWLAGAAFQTDDGGVLLPGLQAPATLDNDANVQAAEFVEVIICDVRPEGCNGTNDCPADFNNDGVVDGADFGAFGAAFGSISGNLEFDPDADFNDDGLIDGADFGAFGAQFGRSDCLD